MLRKTIIALAAVATVATTVAAPTTASAGWRHRHHHHHFHRHGWGWVGPAIVAGAFVTGAAIAAGPGCYRRAWVATPYGPRKVRVFVC